VGGEAISRGEEPKDATAKLNNLEEGTVKAVALPPPPLLPTSLTPFPWHHVTPLSTSTTTPGPGTKWQIFLQSH